MAEDDTKVFESLMTVERHGPQYPREAVAVVESSIAWIFESAVRKTDI